MKIKLSAEAEGGKRNEEVEFFFLPTQSEDQKGAGKTPFAHSLSFSPHNAHSRPEQERHEVFRLVVAAHLLLLLGRRSYGDARCSSVGIVAVVLFGRRGRFDVG